MIIYENIARITGLSMKRFTIPCNFGGKQSPFHIFIGDPDPKNHPLQNQSTWLGKERGGNIPSDVMQSFEKLHEIAKENDVSFEELCVYALGEAQKIIEDEEAEEIEVEE